MATVIIPKYSIPIVSIVNGENFSWTLVENSLYPNEKQIMTPVKRRELSKQLYLYASKMNFETFIEKFKYQSRSHFVEIFAKYQGVCFNSENYTTAEDYLIRILYCYYGKYTNEAVSIVMGLTKSFGYVDKTEREIQDRVDYLQKGPDFRRKYKKCFPMNMGRMVGEALVSSLRPSYRTPYTFGESCLLNLSMIYGVDFLPWKDNTEKKYYFSNSFESETLFTSRKEIFVDLVKHKAHLLNILLDSKEIKALDSDWSSDEDNILIHCFDNWNKGTEMSEIDLYAPLLKLGKSVEACNIRRMQLGIKVARTKQEYRDLYKYSTLTTSQLADRVDTIKRSVYSETLFKGKVENELGKPIHLVSEDEFEEYISSKMA